MIKLEQKQLLMSKHLKLYLTKLAMELDPYLLQVIGNLQQHLLLEQPKLMITQLEVKLNVMVTILALSIKSTLEQILSQLGIKVSTLITEFIAMPMPIAMHTKEPPFAMVKTIVAFIDFKQLIRTSVLGNTTTKVLFVVAGPIMAVAIELAEPIMAVAILELAVIALRSMAVVALRPMAITALVVVTEQH